MNKVRIEALSDGLFAVAMTILIFNVKIPSLLQVNSGHKLVVALWKMWPVFRGYFISFAILGMYWITHHGLFHHFAKYANRSLTYLNILFLSLITLIPFSTCLVGEYPMNPVAVATYGINVIVIGMIQYWMFCLTVKDPQALHEGVTTHQIIHSTVRMSLPPVFAVLGIIAGFFHSSMSFFLFAFPVAISITPGGVDFIMKFFIKRSGEGL